MAKTQENSPNIEKWLKLIRADEVGPGHFRKAHKPLRLG